MIFDRVGGDDSLGGRRFVNFRLFGEIGVDEDPGDFFLLRDSLQPPVNEILAAFLARRWHAPIATTRMIAAGAAGNVRAAMADLEMWLG